MRGYSPRIWSIDGNFPGNLRLVSLYQTLVFAVTHRAIGIPLSIVSVFAIGIRGAVRISGIESLDHLLGDRALFGLLVRCAGGADILDSESSSGNRRWFFAAGIAAAAACLTKSAGLRSCPRFSSAVCGGAIGDPRVSSSHPVLPAIAGWTLWANGHRTPSDQPILWYYTDYIGAFLKNDGGLRALPDIIPHNLLSIMAASGSVVIHDLPDSMPGRFLCILVVAAMVTGAVRIVKRTGLIEYPLFCLFLALTLSLWNFSPTVRLMLPIFPLLAIGLYLEGGVLAALDPAFASRKRFRESRGCVCDSRRAFSCGCLYGIRQNTDLYRSRDSRAVAAEPRIDRAKPRSLSLVPRVASIVGRGAGVR